MTTMTLSEARQLAEEWGNVPMGHVQMPSEYLRRIRDAIDAHLAKGVQVPDERVYAPLPSDADEYDRGHVDGWNACRQSMLSQRGEVE